MSLIRESSQPQGTLSLHLKSAPNPEHVSPPRFKTQKNTQSHYISCINSVDLIHDSLFSGVFRQWHTIVQRDKNNCELVGAGLLILNSSLDCSPSLAGFGSWSSSNHTLTGISFIYFSPDFANVISAHSFPPISSSIVINHYLQLPPHKMIIFLTMNTTILHRYVHYKTFQENPIAHLPSQFTL